MLDDRVELAAPDRAQQRQRLDQVVARHREQPPFRQAGERVAGAADALQQRRDPVRRSDLADEIDVADVDPELERRRRDQRLQLAALEPRLGVEPPLLGQAAVMRGDRVLAEALAQVPRHALGQPPRVDEHQRRPVRAHEVGEAVVVLLPDLVRHHRFERGLRQLELQIDRAPVSFVHDRAVAVRADEEARDGFDRAAASPTARSRTSGCSATAADARATARDARRAACR